MTASDIKPRRDIYREVTERIIAAIESGVSPWQRPWTQLAEMGMPKNASNQRQYQGINTVLLFLVSQERGYADNRWLTFKQADAMGLKVRKGEKSSPVVFFKSLTVEDKDTKPAQTGELAIKTIPYLTEYRVFNAQQIVGMPAATQVLRTWSSVEAAEHVIDQMRPMFIMAATEPFIHLGMISFKCHRWGCLLMLPNITARCCTNWDTGQEVRYG